MFLKSLYNLLLLTKMFESIKNVLKKTFFYCLLFNKTASWDFTLELYISFYFAFFFLNLKNAQKY